MLSIVVGGQISKDEIKSFIQKYLSDIEIDILVKNDLDAVNLISSGKYQYYVGACNTGGGGALAMAMALLGRDKCKTISMPGKIYSKEEVEKAVQEGKVAFGFTAQHYKQVLPILLDSIREKEGI